MSLLSCTGAAVVVQFASIVFNGMGFDAYTSLLLNLPTGAMAFFCVLGSGYCGRKIPNARFHLISIGCLPVILGTCLVWQLTNSQRVGRVIGFYLINFFVSTRWPPLSLPRMSVCIGRQACTTKPQASCWEKQGMKE